MKTIRLALLTLLLALASSSSQAFFFSFSSDFGDDWYFGDRWYSDYYGRTAYHPYYASHPYQHPRFRNYYQSSPAVCNTDQNVTKTVTASEVK